MLYTITRICGHETTVEIDGPQVKHDCLLKWYNSTKCPDCAQPRMEEIRISYRLYKLRYSRYPRKEDSYDAADKTISIYLPSSTSICTTDDMIETIHDAAAEVYAAISADILVGTPLDQDTFYNAISEAEGAMIGAVNDLCPRGGALIAYDAALQWFDSYCRYHSGIDPATNPFVDAYISILCALRRIEHIIEEDGL